MIIKSQDRVEGQKRIYGPSNNGRQYVIWGVNCDEILIRENETLPEFLQVCESFRVNFHANQPLLAYGDEKKKREIIGNLKKYNPEIKIPREVRV